MLGESLVLLVRETSRCNLGMQPVNALFLRKIIVLLPSIDFVLLQEDGRLSVSQHFDHIPLTHEKIIEGAQPDVDLLVVLIAKVHGERTVWTAALTYVVE